jgi:hypothetical protein
MIVEAAKLDATQYTVQYELLRSQIIGTAGNVAQGNTAGQPRGTGLALMLSEGMAGWLKTLETVLRASLAPRALDSSEPSSHEGSRGAALPQCGCRACTVITSLRFWRVWFSRLARSRANQRRRVRSYQ